MGGDGAHQGTAAKVICKREKPSSAWENHMATAIQQDNCTAHRPEVMMRDRAETEADLGTRLPGEALCLSGTSFWLPSRRLPPGSRPRGVEFLVPVLLLRRRIRFRLTRSAAQRGGGRVWGHRKATPCHAGPRLPPEHPAPVPTANTPDSAEGFAALPVPASGSPSTNLGLSGLEDATQGLSSSEEKANLGMVSRL